jgi:general secretion pathway protein D
MRRSAAGAFLLLLCLTALAARPVPAAARQDPVRVTGQGIMLNFQDVDLAYAITALAQAASLNVVYTDLPQKPVTLRTASPVNASDIATLIRRLAEANDVTVTEEAGFMRLQGRPQVAEAQEPRQLYIYKLRHARAPVLATTLQQLFGGATIRAGSAAQAATTLSQQLRQMELQQQQAGRGGQPPQGPQQFVITTGRPGELEGNVLIVPDEVTNSLLVRATAADWQVVQQAVQGLDLRPLQVVIEVIVAEVQRTDDLNVGVAFSATDPDGTETGELPTAAAPDNFSLRVIRTGEVNIEATLSALSRTGNVRILSRPVVHAQNNQEARIHVGSERPFVQVSTSGLGQEPAVLSTVQYRDVGTTLTITPTINDEGYVNLLVTQEVSNATAEVQFGAPIISTREASTQLLARNGQTVVIGGLVDHLTEKSRSGIPFLKDIPIIGFLFGTTRDVRANSELFLFLTPYVVASDADADRLREQLERNLELLQPLMPVQSILPPRIRTIVPDTVRDGA